MSVSKKNGSPGMQRQQGGAYAVEYAIVFPIFFMLLYGTLAYGTIFTMRLGLQHAAEEGARAALRYQPQPADAEPDAPLIPQITLRENAAEVVARVRASWINDLGTLDVKKDICPTTPGTDCLPPSGTLLNDNLDCGDTGCQVIVTVTYPYSTHPVFPSIPGFGLLFPEQLQGRARALIDGRALDL
ncbi:MAG: TadE/TadG family type IV pilus assembly protein [Panacagrimonas sp.]